MPWGLITLLLAGLVLVWVMIVLYTAWQQLHPMRRAYAFAVSRSIPGDPSEVATDASGTQPRGLEYTSWTVRSRGIELPIWDIRGKDPAGPTIIITHGWGESRVLNLPRAAALAPIASRIILWDMPAHGDSDRGGRFTLGCREHLDLLAIIERVRGSGDTSPLVLHGFSLGAGVSIAAASVLPPDRAPALVIAEAPYAQAITPVRNLLALRSLPHAVTLPPAMALLGLWLGVGPRWRGFDRTRLASTLPAATKLLVLHGAEDLISPPADGQAVAAAAPNGAVAAIQGAGHTNLWTTPEHAQRCTSAMLEAMGRSSRVTAIA